MEENDKELVRRFTEEGDKKAFDALFERHFEATYRFAYSRLGNRTWAEDITSETFFVFLEVIKSYDGSSSVRSFIIGIALNKIRQFWYSQVKQAESNVDIENISEERELLGEPEQYDEEREAKIEAIVSNILSQLQENYRSVLAYRFIERKSIKETAALMGITEDNVSVLQNRALKKAVEIANN